MIGISKEKEKKLMRTSCVEGLTGLAVGDVIYVPESKEEMKLVENIFRMVAKKHVMNDLDIARPYIRTGLSDILIGEGGKHVTYDSGAGLCIEEYEELKVLLSVLELLEESDKIRFKFKSADEFSLSVASDLGGVVFETYSEFQKFQDERNENPFMRGAFGFINSDDFEEAEDKGFYKKGFRAYLVEDVV